MGVLEDLSTGARHPLRPDHLIGRSERVDLRVDDRSVSSEHARLRWSGRAWVLRDLGSKNGTWVAGRRLGAGESAAVAAGDALSFGGEAPRFRLASADGPAISAVDRSGRRVFGRRDLLALPDEARADLVIVGDGEHWHLETEAGVRAVADGEVVTHGDESWTLALPEAAPGTWDREQAAGTTLADVTLRFRVSMDEEHCELAVDAGGKVHPLGSRAHHYLLLTLARLRLEDAADPALRPTAHGWVSQDRLLQMLGQREGGLHVAVFRARAELSELGIADAAGLVERRKGSQQLRLGVSRAVVEVV